MDGQDRIIRIEEIWTTIQCGQCSDCFKVLKDKHRRQMNCPYCSSSIEIAAAEPAEPEATLLDGMAAIGVDAFNDLQKVKKVTT